MNRKDYLLLKSPEEKLSFLMQLSYPVLYSFHSEHRLFISFLNLRSQDSDILRAKTRLEENKKQYFQDMISHGVDHEIPFPESLNLKMTGARLIQESLRPVCIFLFVIVLSFASAKIFSSTLLKGISKAEQKLENVGNVDAVKKQERLDRFKKVMEEARPYIQEIKKTWNE